VWWRRRRCAAPVPPLPLPLIRMSVGELAVRPRRALAVLALGGGVIVLVDGGVLGVLTRDWRVRRDVRRVLALQSALGLTGAGDEGETG
jgi:hypothetical protein